MPPMRKERRKRGKAKYEIKGRQKCPACGSTLYIYYRRSFPGASIKTSLLCIKSGAEYPL